MAWQKMYVNIFCKQKVKFGDYVHKAWQYIEHFTHEGVTHFPSWRFRAVHHAPTVRCKLNDNLQ